MINENAAPPRDAISTTFIWRTAIREIKLELIKRGYRSITFLGYETKDNKVQYISDGIYNVADVVAVMTPESSMEKKHFSVTVLVYQQDAEFICKADSFKIYD